MLDEVIDELRCFFVCQLGITDTSTAEQILQVRVKIVGIKTRVWIPPNMSDMFESTRCSDICLSELWAFLLSLFVLFAYA